MSNIPRDCNHVLLRTRTRCRKIDASEISRRLSLPSDVQLPIELLSKLALRSPSINADAPIPRVFRRQSLSEIGFGKLETYIKLDKLGEGAYASVFKGRSRLTNNLVALKEIRLEHEEGAPCTAIREVSLLRGLKHYNIVTLHDVIYTEKTLTLVFEFLDRDLKQYMDDCHSIMSMNNVKLFLFQLLRGLSYCHKRRVLHRDLKPQNLLINEIGELKLADFGLARAKSVPSKTFSNEVVTLWYRPPDVLMGSTEYTTSIDIWGVGCIFFEMSSGRALFPGSTVDDELHLIFKTLGTPNKNMLPPSQLDLNIHNYTPTEPLSRRIPRLDTDGLELLHKFLTYDPKTRISATDAMKSRYFASLGQSVHSLPDTLSIFSLPGISLTRDPGSKSTIQSCPAVDEARSSIKHGNSMIPKGSGVQEVTSGKGMKYSSSSSISSSEGGRKSNSHRMTSFQFCASAFHNLSATIHQRLHNSSSSPSSDG